MQVSYTPEEIQVYSYYFNSLDQQGTGVITGKDSVAFFKSSGLNTPILRDIWNKTSGDGEVLTKDEFFASLKLVSLAQAGHNVDIGLLQRNIQTPLPIFQGFQVPPIEIQPDQYQKYENYFNSVSEGQQIIQGGNARQIFMTTKLPREQLGELWRLCDIGEKGYLSKGEFIVAVHLINLCKKGVPLPPQLPDSLLQVAQGGQAINQPQSQPRIGSGVQRLGSNSNFQTVVQQPRRLGSGQFGSIQPIQPPPQQRLGSNSMFGFQQPQAFIQQPQQYVQQPQLASQIQGIPGYDSIQSQIIVQRQFVNENSQQLAGLTGQMNALYSSTLQEKQDELNQMRIVNENLQVIVKGLTDQFEQLNSQLNILSQQKAQLKNQNQQLVNQVQQKSQQNFGLIQQIQGHLDEVVHDQHNGYSSVSPKVQSYNQFGNQQAQQIQPIQSIQPIQIQPLQQLQQAVQQPQQAIQQPVQQQYQQQYQQPHQFQQSQPQSQPSQIQPQIQSFQQQPFSPNVFSPIQQQQNQQEIQQPVSQFQNDGYQPQGILRTQKAEQQPQQQKQVQFQEDIPW